MFSILTWVRDREHPLACRLYVIARSIKFADIPIVPIVHKTLFNVHKMVAVVLSEGLRLFYWTPLFRTQLSGSHRRLHLAGHGLPLVTGPVRVKVGDDCRFSTAVTISGRASSRPHPRLEIGSNVGIGWQTTICVGSRVVFEDNVRIAGRAFLAGYPGHPLDSEARAAGLPDEESQIGDIVLRKDVWLGTGCIVSPGVEIGEGTIVAAGSVVTKDLPPYVLAAGTPAKALRPLAFSSSHAENDTVVALKVSK